MTKKISSTQPCGRNSKVKNGAFLKCFSIFKCKLSQINDIGWGRQICLFCYRLFVMLLFLCEGVSSSYGCLRKAVLSAPLSQRLTRWAYRMGLVPSSVCLCGHVSVRPSTLSNIDFSEVSRPIAIIFYLKHHWG